MIPYNNRSGWVKDSIFSVPQVLFWITNRRRSYYDLDSRLNIIHMNMEGLVL
jgi:hypothetical protein